MTEATANRRTEAATAGIDFDEAVCAIVLWIFGYPCNRRGGMHVCPTVEDSLDYIIGRSGLHAYPTISTAPSTPGDMDGHTPENFYCRGLTGFQGVMDLSIFDMDIPVKEETGCAMEGMQVTTQVTLADYASDLMKQADAGDQEYQQLQDYLDLLSA